MSKQVAFEGILPALITPLTADAGAVDYAALTTIVEDLIAAGVHGLVPCGSTGEFVTLSHDERRAVVETVTGAAA
ncbi:MAG: dihydrodipicolinate synthase family protein, partial [Actinobacteria bacterium]|nr:dihydrodipicolinate synthase family protein [Actinomycetota bacterium]